MYNDLSVVPSTKVHYMYRSFFFFFSFSFLEILKLDSIIRLQTGPEYRIGGLGVPPYAGHSFLENKLHSCGNVIQIIH